MLIHMSGSCLLPLKPSLRSPSLPPRGAGEGAAFLPFKRGVKKYAAKDMTDASLRADGVAFAINAVTKA